MDTRVPNREQEAFFEGLRAGRQHLSAGLNPHHSGTPEYSEWERGRSSIEAQRASEAISQRARVSQCRYTVGACSCGGRGLCLDVA